MVLKVFTSILTVALSSQAFATEGVYSFMGACQSQGSWTSEALSHTKKLRSIIQNIKNNDDCSALNKQMDGLLTRLEATTSQQSDDGSKIDSTIHIRREMGALATFAKQKTPLFDGGLALLLEGYLKAADQKGAEMTGIQGKSPLQQQEIARKIGMRADRAMAQSLTVFDELIGKVPQADQCLDNASMGAFLGSSVKLLSTFGYDGNRSSQLASSTSKLFEYLRQAKYVKALRKLNEVEFRQSLSCLIETTTENYCNTADAMALLNRTAETLQVGKHFENQTAFRQPPVAQPREGLVVNDPLTGFMVISHHIPNLSNWLLNLQIGVSPQNLWDADFKNTHIENITSFFQEMNTLQGTFNDKKVTLRSFTDPKTQQNHVMNTLIWLSNRLMLSNSDKKTNFFRMTAQEVEMPFHLLGLEGAPAEVTTGVNGLAKIGVDDYLNAKKDIIFANPIEVMDRIEKNLEAKINAAHEAAIQSYNTWLIADPATIALDAAANAPYSVIQSIKVIDGYLANVERRIRKLNTDEVNIMLPAISDTRARLQSVLMALRSLKPLLDQATTTDERTLIWKKTVEVAYNQFNILLSRAGFISNRLNRIVYFDFVHNLRNNPNISRYEREIVESGFKAAFDQILGMSNSNFSQVEADLKNASYINLKNLEAIESVFKPAWMGIVSRSRLEMQKGSVNDLDVTWDSVKRAFADPFVPYSHQNKSAEEIARLTGPKRSLWDRVKGFVGATAAPFRLAFEHEKYRVHLSDYTKSNASSKADLHYLYSQFCTQSLAFQSWKDFISICKDANLAPFYLRKIGERDAAYYGVNFMRKAQEGETNRNKMDPNKPDTSNTYHRVCALRDYHRRNNVLIRVIQFKEQQEKNSSN